MAETIAGKNQTSKIDPEAKYKRLQEIGLSMVLAIPFALVAGETFGLVRALIAQICILLFYCGFAFFVLGHEKRQEIIKQNDIDCPK